MRNILQNISVSCASLFFCDVCKCVIFFLSMRLCVYIDNAATYIVIEMYYIQQTQSVKLSSDHYFDTFAARCVVNDIRILLYAGHVHHLRRNRYIRTRVSEVHPVSSLLYCHLSVEIINELELLYDLIDSHEQIYLTVRMYITI